MKLPGPLSISCALMIFLVVACTEKPIDTSSSTTSVSTPTTTTTPRSETLDALADLAIDDQAATDLTKPELVLTQTRYLEFAFKRPTMSSCLQKVTLSLFVSWSSADEPVEIDAYPSAQTQAQDLRAGDVVGVNTILALRPKAAADVTSRPGEVHWDVTDLVKRWLNQKSFEQPSIVAPADAPIVITLAPANSAPATFSRSFVSNEGIREHRPTLGIESSGRCPG